MDMVLPWKHDKGPVPIYKTNFSILALLPRCVQVRKRHCVVPSICSSNVLKEERPCQGPARNRAQRKRMRKCSRHNSSSSTSSSSSGSSIGHKGKKSRARGQPNFTIVKRRKLSRKTRGMLKFNKAFYTRWSKWGPCSNTCKAMSSRSCKFALICGSSAVHEEAYCYVDGSLCEDWFRQGKSLSMVEHYRNGRLDEEDLFQVCLLVAAFTRALYSIQ